MKKLLVQILVLLTLVSCAGKQIADNDDNEPGFGTRLFQGIGMVLKGVGSGLVNANQNDKSFTCTSSSAGDQVYTSCQ